MYSACKNSILYLKLHKTRIRHELRTEHGKELFFIYTYSVQNFGEPRWSLGARSEKFLITHNRPGQSLESVFKLDVLWSWVRVINDPRYLGYGIIRFYNTLLFFFPFRCIYYTCINIHCIKFFPFSVPKSAINDRCFLFGANTNAANAVKLSVTAVLQTAFCKNRMLKSMN